jgi:hypothetical protein
LEALQAEVVASGNAAILKGISPAEAPAVFTIERTPGCLQPQGEITYIAIAAL